MLKRLGFPIDALRIGLSKTSVSLLRSTGILRRRNDVVGQQLFSSLSVSEIETELRILLNNTQFRNIPTTVILSDDWVRLFVVTPPGNATRLQDCSAAADMRFQTLYGESMDDWNLAADWNESKPFLACAIPNLLLSMLNKVATEYSLRLIEMTPQFIASWNRWQVKIQPSIWFGSYHDTSLTLALTTKQGLCAIRTTTVPHEGLSNKQWLSDHVRREALRLNLVESPKILLSGQFPQSWKDDIDGSIVCQQLDPSTLDSHGANLSPALSLARCGMK